jgi:hypothetical protein
MIKKCDHQTVSSRISSLVRKEKAPFDRLGANVVILMCEKKDYKNPSPNRGGGGSGLNFAKTPPSILPLTGEKITWSLYEEYGFGTIYSTS